MNAFSTPTTGSFGTPRDRPGRYTAEVLDALASEALIGHDVAIPDHGERIDHIVVTGRVMLMICSISLTAGYHHGWTGKLVRNAGFSGGVDYTGFGDTCVVAANVFDRLSGVDTAYDPTVFAWQDSQRPTVVCWSGRRLDPPVLPAYPYLLNTVTPHVRRHSIAYPELGEAVAEATDGTVRVDPRADA